MVTHVSNFSTQEAEAGRQQACEQCSLQSETVSKETSKKEAEEFLSAVYGKDEGMMVEEKEELQQQVHGFQHTWNPSRKTQTWKMWHAPA